MKKILKISSIFLLLVTIVSCGNNTTQKNAENNQEEHGEEAEHEGETSNFVSLQQKQLDVMNVELGTVKKVNLGATLKVNGQLEVPPQSMASLSAIIGGRVESVAVIEGDYVKKGQVIARLNNPEFITMQREYLSARSNISFLEKDYQRKKELLKDGITSARAFQESEAAYLEGISILNTSKSTLQLIGIDVSSLDNSKIISSVPVISPIKGYIENVEINIGKFVSPQQEMFEIVDNEHLHLGLKVFEKDIDKVKVEQRMTFSLTTRPDKIYEAEIFNVGKVLEMKTRAVKVHAEIIDSREEFLAGMFVEARIVTDTKEVNALPNEAFIHQNGLDYVFIQKEAHEGILEFEKIQVNKGMSDLGYSEVVFINDLPKDTIIITKGAYYVNSEMQKSEFGDDD